jgi:hypothetical protein
MELIDLLKKLDFERLAGTTGEEKARLFFKNYLSNLKINHFEHGFEMNVFNSGNATITTKNTTYKAQPLGLVKTTTVSGKLRFIENSELFFCQRGMFKDKIILTNSRSWKLADKLKEEGALAVMYISPPNKELLALNLRQAQYEDGAVPAVYISYEDAKSISKLDGQEITINIEQNVEKKTAYNLVIDIPGTGPDKTLTCVVAHYDSVATSNGATDNAAGSVICLKIA